MSQEPKHKEGCPTKNIPDGTYGETLTNWLNACTCSVKEEHQASCPKVRALRIGEDDICICSPVKEERGFIIDPDGNKYFVDGLPSPVKPQEWELPKRFKFMAEEFPEFEADLRSLLAEKEAEAYERGKEDALGKIATGLMKGAIEEALASYREKVCDDCKKLWPKH